MRRIYVRWIVLSIVFGVIAVLGVSRYNKEVRTISPKKLLAGQPVSDLRVMGRVDAGSLVKGTGNKPFRFTLSGEGEGEKVPVFFPGDDQETLRELKTIVVIGQWDKKEMAFKAREIALIPNYGFITYAYLASLIPLAFFLFLMERKVALLYIMIKEEKPYQPETGT